MKTFLKRNIKQIYNVCKQLCLLLVNSFYCPEQTFLELLTPRTDFEKLMATNSRISNIMEMATRNKKIETKPNLQFKIQLSLALRYLTLCVHIKSHILKIYAQSVRYCRA